MTSKTRWRCERASQIEEQVPHAADETVRGLRQMQWPVDTVRVERGIEASVAAAVAGRTFFGP
jgi:hypothetical protein